MPCDQNVRKTWRKVPDGSVLEFSMNPSDDEYGLDLCWRANAVAGSDCDERWPRSDVTPGPKPKTLTAGDRYDLDVRLDFLGQAETVVEVRARITRPDGTGHGSEYFARHAGVNGDSCETLLVILTEEDSSG